MACRNLARSPCWSKSSSKNTIRASMDRRMQTIASAAQQQHDHHHLLVFVDDLEVSEVDFAMPFLPLRCPVAARFSSLFVPNRSPPSTALSQQILLVRCGTGNRSFCRRCVVRNCPRWGCCQLAQKGKGPSLDGPFSRARPPPRTQARTASSQAHQELSIGPLVW